MRAMDVISGSAPWAVEQGDAVAFLATLPSKSVDLLVTDPAYESLEKHRKVGTTTRLKKDWFEIFHNSRFPDFFMQASRVLKSDSHLYVLCDQETMFVVKPMAEAMGFRFWKPIIWDKQQIGMGYHYRCRYEVLLFFEKGKRNLSDLGIPDVLSFPRVNGGYPTEKPRGLLEVLIKQSSSFGDVICDPFCGSGSTLHAALNTGRRAIGCDLSTFAAESSAIRLTAALEPASPPPTGEVIRFRVMSAAERQGSLPLGLRSVDAKEAEQNKLEKDADKILADADDKPTEDPVAPESTED